MTRRERATATMDGEFVVFLIGMRINRPLMVHRWLPVVTAMGRMLGELHRQQAIGQVQDIGCEGLDVVRAGFAATPQGLRLRA